MALGNLAAVGRASATQKGLFYTSIPFGTPILPVPPAAMKSAIQCFQIKTQITRIDAEKSSKSTVICSTHSEILAQKTRFFATPIAAGLRLRRRVFSPLRPPRNGEGRNTSFAGEVRAMLPTFRIFAAEKILNKETRNAGGL